MGAVMAWNPSADAYANAVTLNSSGSKVIIGGRFQNVGGQAAYGMAATDPVSGAVLPWATTTLVRNAGPNAGINSLIATPDGVYGSGYVFGAGGNLEGMFRADNETGQVIWIEDCHGDTYSVYQRADVVYQTGHHHYCGNVNSFGQTNPWNRYYATSFTRDATQTITPDVYGYFNWAGNPAPSVLNWFPTFTPGAVTSSKQAGWSITGTGKYVLYGGEFLRVNGVGQQGLVRFATSDVAPNKDKPFDDDAGLTPALASVAAGAVRVGWQATYDRDNEALTYKVFRNFTSLANTPVYQATVNSTFWKRPSLSFTDTTAVPGQSYSYRVYAFDPFGNSVTGAAATITVAGQASEVDAYASGVLRDGATAYYRLGDAAGATTLADLAGSDTMVPNAGVTLGSPGAFAASSNTAASFSGTTTGTAAGRVSQYGPNTFSVEAWFQTTSTTGGKIVGYSGWPLADAGSAGNDRHLYMDNAGRVLFGVYQDTNRVLASAAGLNDGAWHHVVGTLAPTGMQLYVDGRRVGNRTDTTAGRYYTGVWKIGGDTLTGWPNQPTSRYFKGAIDDVAVYPTALSPGKIAGHYTTSGRTPTTPAALTDVYGKAVVALDPDLFWRLDEASGSTAKDSGPAGNTGSVIGGLTWASPGALYGQATTSATLNGTNAAVVSTTPTSGPGRYSTAVWFKTTTTRGGKLIGFGNAPSGQSTSYDRHVYMQNDGRLVFGTYTGVQNTITSANPYNDGRWHLVVATQGPDGMALYVDGALAGTHPQTAAQNYAGYWRIGGDVTWGSSSNYFAGSLDEASVFSRALSASEAGQLWALGTVPKPNVAPSAVFTSTVKDLKASFDARTSTDSDGTITDWAWDFGDGTTGSGATTTRTYSAAGTYTVELTVTDDDGAAAVSSQTVTVTEPPNSAPTASFSATVDKLSASFDATGSTDADGTIASYAWDFSDGTTATGPSPTHVFGAAGTYPVVLTVTDDDGATGTLTKDVVVVANARPVANFTATTSGLTLALDSAGSSDSDGSLAGFSWDFGDGSPGGSGAKTTHVYSTGGTYQVALTVTDNDGASTTLTKPVVVSGFLARDAFDRVVSGGFGPADTGGAWTTSGGASSFSVSGGKGRVTLPTAGAARSANLATVASIDTDVQADASWDKPATGGGTYFALNGRVVGTSAYRGKVQVFPSGAVTVYLVKLVAGVETTLGSAKLTGTYAPGDVLSVRMQAVGGAPTALKLKAWRSGTSEPGSWAISTTDETGGLQTAGSVGMYFYLSGSATNAPVTLTVDDFSARRS